MAKIIGNTVGIPNPQPDWNQTDEIKADYIKNKPKIPSIVDDLETSDSSKVLSAKQGVELKAFIDALNASVSEIDSHMPYISEDGWWYVWDTDTKAYVNTEIKADLEPLIVNVTIGSDDTVTTDKNATEIIAAHKEGKTVMAVVDNSVIIPLVQVDDSNFPDNCGVAFAQMISDGLVILTNENDNWSISIEEMKSDIEPLIVNVTLNSNGTAIADRNGVEIATAFNEGRNIIIRDDYAVFSLIAMYDAGLPSYGEAWFANINETNLRILWCMGDSWGYADYTLEHAVNKVKTLDQNNTHSQYPSAKAVVDYVLDIAGKVSTGLSYDINLLKPTVITSITNDTLLLNYNQEARLGELTTLILSIPEITAELYSTYESEFSFRSSETPTTLTYSSTPIVWRGDDCDELGDFVPEANTSYEVSIKRLGSDVIARVGAY